MSAAKKLIYQLKFPLIRARTRLKFLLDKNPILIYQMGKVGSSSVHHSIKKQIPERSIYHFHSIHKDAIDGHNANNKKFIKAGEFGKVFTGIPFVEEMNKRITKGSDFFDIITLVREPISRNLSFYFQNAHRLTPDFKEKCIDGTLDIKQMVENFHKKKHIHTRGLIWLDREIEGVLGINVYDSSFPKEKGYKIYEGKNARLLLMRMEDLSTMASVIGSFLGKDDFYLENNNEATQKYYSEAYKQFKKQIRFSEEYIENLYSHRFCTHFYTPEELQLSKERWLAS